ncbi:MAG: PAS domain-containing protein [Paracoccaceae bacterium]
MRDDESLKAALGRLPVAMALSDPDAADNPLVYVNDAFERTTLYRREAAIGRNCRFLQGEDTDPDAVDRLRAAIAERRDVSVDLVNYKADGTPFTNRLRISPIFAEDDTLVAFLGIQTELVEGEEEPPCPDPRRGGRPVDDVMLRELQHRVKNHLAMVVMMIRAQTRRGMTEASLEALGHRVESLALLYEELTPAGVASVRRESVAAGAYLGRVANTIAALDGRASVRVNIACEEIELPVETAARLGLILTELLTNALEHAFRNRDEGVVRVRFQRQSGRGLRLMVEDDGVGLPEGHDWPKRAPSVETQRARAEGEAGELDTKGGGRRSGLGGSIVRALVVSLDGRLSVSSATYGTIATLDVPAPG